MLSAVLQSQDFKLPPEEKPPLLIKIHGGPTSQASTAFNLGIQYWTSRGPPMRHTQRQSVGDKARLLSGLPAGCCSPESG